MMVILCYHLWLFQSEFLVRFYLIHIINYLTSSLARLVHPSNSNLFSIWNCLKLVNINANNYVIINFIFLFYFLELVVVAVSVVKELQSTSLLMLIEEYWAISKNIIIQPLRKCQPIWPIWFKRDTKQGKQGKL